MGIKGLTNLIADLVPGALVEKPIDAFEGRVIAIDASMSLYQFLVAVRPDDMGQYTLTNDYGETTSHLTGLFYRTIRMLTHGLKPVYVFDGKPPEMKSGELAKRQQRKQDALEELEKAEDEGDKEMIKKLNKRSVRVTPEMNEDAKMLLKLMGVPFVNAPSEAEAQCAVLAKSGKVWATGSEDMDSLTCGTTILLRRLTVAESKKLPILEIHLDKVLAGLGLNMDEFIDLCILCGCDYAQKIRGIGPKKAYEFIKKYGSIEEMLKKLDKDKYPIPENFPYEEIRNYFKNPETTPADQIDITFVDPDEEGLIQFLCKEKGFSEDRVKKGIEKIKKARGKGVQSRLTSFFTTLPTQPQDSPVKKSPAKQSKTASPSSKKRPAGSQLQRSGGVKKLKSSK